MELINAISAFDQIRKHATKDQFLTVFSDSNRKLYSITEDQYSLVINAAMSQLSECAHEDIKKRYQDSHRLCIEYYDRIRALEHERDRLLDMVKYFSRETNKEQ